MIEVNGQKLGSLLRSDAETKKLDKTVADGEQAPVEPTKTEAPKAPARAAAKPAADTTTK